MSISSTFYEQLLRPQILKVHKKTVKSSSFFALSGSVWVKGAHRTLMKLTSYVDKLNLVWWFGFKLILIMTQLPKKY